MDSLNFVQSVNPINKQVEWLVVGDDYDYHQEIAVSCYGDMLHDDERVMIKLHSTSLTVGENGELKQKANILVSEVFDTELIGEGAIHTFNHAFKNLLTEDCIVIPSSGTVYAQVVESNLAQSWNKLRDWKTGNEVLLKIPDDIQNCGGTGAVHDIQLSEFKKENFKPLSEVIPIFKWI
ncbi:protein arginine N-methyltransferase, putative [Pediculus humanus corporis]|uniref:Protein arginine N-methyltransferase, putative n=1 Tax=Pediculus humanus subsp. corporis TaxID=121224 RepID=E0VPL7_PEDHC|nr:protein arginine N-methyltransferase, putative [Pediculus humanus corporis]EEB15323.1 protein arginine N-methyltransferase, putative [Pediculus humanus corporis]